jgi:AraC-like DNA-binding protein
MPKEFGALIFYACFFTTLLFAGLLAMLQNSVTKEQAYKWYLRYLFFTFFYYVNVLCCAHLPGMGVHLLGKLPISLEVSLGYLAYIAYFGFIGSFLMLPEKAPRLQKWVVISSYVFGVLLCFNLLVQVTAGLALSQKIHNLTRLLFLPLAMVFIWSVLFRYKVPESKYILIGSAFLTLGALFSSLRSVLPDEQSPSIFFGVFAGIKVGELTIIFFSMKSAILLEIFFFSLALTYRFNRMTGYSVPEVLSFAATGSNENTEPVKMNSFVQKVKELIESNLDNENYSVSSLCKELHLSGSQVRRKILAGTGRSTELYIRFIRISKAKELLETTDLSISEIATRVGFKDPSYFSKTFHKETGFSPKDWRQKNQGTSKNAH